MSNLSADTGAIYPPERALLALDPASSPDLLLELSRELPALVVANAGCPSDLFFKLAERHPREALKNPSLELMLLGWGLRAFSPQAMHAILQLAEAPKDWFYWALDELPCAQNSTLALGLAQSSYTPREVLRQMVTRPSITSLRGCACSRGFIEEALESPLRGVRVSMVASRWAPGWVLEKAARHRDAALRKAAAAHHLTPIEAVVTLLRDPCKQVRQKALLSRKLPEKELEKGLAMTPREQRTRVLRERARKDPKNFKAALARLGQTPPAGDALSSQLLRLLREETHPRLALRCARAEGCPGHVLDMLHRSRHSEVRLAVALHRNSSNESLKTLARDRNQRVREAAQKSLGWRALNRHDETYAALWPAMKG